jgi:phosphomannomutase
MNRVVIAQTTAGLARFLLEQRQSTSPKLRVVIGCDARTNSDVFATDTAEVFSGHGIEAIVLPHAIPTPLLAFAVRKLGVDAGVMVTASHNPPEDNGYKVYMGGSDEGSQIVPPTDQDIERHIHDVAKDLSWENIPRSTDLVTPAPANLLADYVSATVASVAPKSNKSTPLTVVYTPLHGVGADTFFTAVSVAGFPAVEVVTEQVKPDPLFPTVSFPNPEEKGALDLSYEKARALGADLVLAHDPDADRLAVALPDPTAEAGYRALTGNQLGAILGWWAAERAQRAGTSGALANSLVSSPVLGAIAKHFSLEHHETLTGFKYVSRIPHLIFGFEEALGYLVTPDVVRDKDGISAGLAILDIAYTCASRGETLADYLAMVESAVGSFASGQVTIRLNALAGEPSLTDSLRASPPTRIGSTAIVRQDDFMTGVSGFPPENILRYYLENGSRVIVRPSGTEPKLKVYLDTTGPTRAAAEASLKELEMSVRELIETLT